jgi:hypothetical protein
MAARVAPDDVPAAHQAMHHIMAKANWDDGAFFHFLVKGVKYATLYGHGGPCPSVVNNALSQGLNQRQYRLW